MNSKLSLIALVLVAVLGSSCSGKKDVVAVDVKAAQSMEQIYAENGNPVSVRKLESEDFSVFLKYPTVLYASSESTAYAGLSEVVRKINVNIGDYVEQGDVILSFSADNQNFEQARLSYENIQKAFSRASALFANADISRSDFDTVKTQYEISKTAYEAAKDMIYIKAPIAGTVSRINVHTTENVRVGASLFTISGRNGFETRFYVGANEIDRIQTGARVYIDGQNIEGRITQVSLIMDGARQAFPVTAFFDIENPKLVSGMGVDVAVETYRNENAIVVSRRELMRTDTGYTAYVSVNDTAKPIAVEVGHEQGLQFEITAGLIEGDMLISSGQQRLVPETNLNIVALAAAK
jgi:RND family efflux transporter MFP subunit